jgi:short-subunit dehydrogenase
MKKNFAGKTVLLTGASGGLGIYMAEALADLGMNLALIAYPGIELENLQKKIENKGRRAIAFPADLRVDEQRHFAIEKVSQEFGKIDVLVNNAGIEFTSAFHDLSEKNIQEIIAVNLEAPMILSRLVLPEMLKRGSGHIVNISSLAGKVGPAFQEPYAATKAGLVAFTSSLRATYRGSGVSASVIVPGFVEAGIYTNLKERTHCSAPALMGTSSPQKVAQAVVRCLERDVPEIIINRWPVKPLLALCIICPGLGAWAVDKIGANQFFKNVVAAQAKEPSSSSS